MPKRQLSAFDAAYGPSNLAPEHLPHGRSVKFVPSGYYWNEFKDFQTQQPIKLLVLTSDDWLDWVIRPVNGRMLAKLLGKDPEKYVGRVIGIFRTMAGAFEVIRINPNMTEGTNDEEDDGTVAGLKDDMV